MPTVLEPYAESIPSPANPADKLYLPKLDGLRAISIALVLIEHFYGNRFGTGGLGVTIFFVISGYLITSILFTYTEEFSIKKAALTFYWRRTLRLFPVYYFCIAATAALNLAGMRKLWLYNVLYLMNFKIAFDHSWTGPFHFWSLAVEEQFYLLWFLIIAMVPARYLLKVILLIILLAHLWRVMIVSIGVSIFWDYLLPGVMDSLAMGALIAYATRKAPQSRWWLLFLRFRMPLLLISFLLLVLTYKRSYGSAFSSIFLRSFWTLCSACLVSFGIEQRKDWRFDWLGNKILRHFGKISYGIYVFHLFVPGIFHLPGLQRLHMESKPIFIQLIVFSLIAWWIAEISWHFLEKPILNLKDKAPFWVHS